MTAHPDVAEIGALSVELLDEARAHDARRAARTLVTGVRQRATLIALAGGAELGEHDAPPAATLYIITGQVRLHTHDAEWLLNRNHLMPVPRLRHGITALTDSVVLLTVALG
ncbi:hypothetical protein [Saccharothrix obliqua]|uniref:hypothetical protein n=1 Tax=Saccharothrix obliqua TaxID=2861747 RepID=UPI001C5F1ADE|nr:hypothetical protein [Saccharothrix obliqua]MBW4718682.1 hypothetical protein [Saccharothrix obliqua]